MTQVMANPFLEENYEEYYEEVFSEYNIRKEDVPYHPYYYTPQGKNKMNDPLYKAVQEFKKSRKPKAGQRPTKRTNILKEISQQDEINRKEIIEEWITEKTQKDSKLGRPKKYTELEIRAIQDAHIEWEFGFKKISAILSNKPLSERDSKLFIFLLFRAEWKDEDIKALLNRIFEGKSKMSPIQAKRLKEQGMDYLSN